MKFFECEHCKNLAILINDSKVPMVCCGEPMKELVAGSKDAAKEKHVPAVTIKGNEMQVAVGEVLHPMTMEHYIQWILVEQGEKVQYVKLSPSDQPKASFIIESGKNYTVYEYCNLHGLWKTEGKA